MACFLSFLLGIIVGAGGIILWSVVEWCKNHPPEDIL